MHYTQEVLSSQGFVYHPDLFGNLKRAMAWVDPNHSERFDNWDIDETFGRRDKENYMPGCVCGHDILYEFRIKHKTTGDTMEIGSHCIDRFSDEMKIKRNHIVQLQHNPTTKYCPTCNIKVSPATAEKYVDEEKVYHQSCYKELPFDCEFCDAKPKNKYKKSHMKTHKKEIEARRLAIYNNEEVKCEWCETTPKRKDMTGHMKIHAEEIHQNAIITCEICNLSLKRKDMVSHLNGNHLKELMKQAMMCNMPHGKYKGLTLGEIYKNDKGYFYWMNRSYDGAIIRNWVGLILNGRITSNNW